MLVHLRVITPITTSGFRQLGHLKALETPGLEISHVEIATGPGLHRDRGRRRSLPVSHEAPKRRKALDSLASSGVGAWDLDVKDMPLDTAASRFEGFQLKSPSRPSRSAR